MNGKRKFSCSAVSVLAFIVDKDERILLFAHSKRKGEWEVVNGALEVGETLLEGILREVRPLGTVHAYTILFDDNVQYMLSILYLLAYEGGEIQPGDDMRGSQYRWWSIKEFEEAGAKLIVPRDQTWIMQRAIELHRLWKDQSVDLQPERDPKARSKYNL